jgi:translation initiation factor IF-2
MSLDDIKPAELIMLRFVINEADKLNADELDKLHYIEKAARQGSLENLTNELTSMYNKVRAKAS